MAENTSEIDAINHLLEVEKNAAALISDAAEEADRRLSQARAQYNAEYKNRYEKEAARLEAEFQTAHEQIAEKYQKEIDSYKESLAAKPQDSKAFSATLEKLIF